MSGIELGPALQWLAFLIMAIIAIAGALGMTTTMSMFRSGIFLMGSFLGVAGLFILLLADLLALLQVMMYIGGMLVMILFMVLFAHDPGGDKMADMQMSLVERLFTLGIPPAKSDGHGPGHNAEQQQHEEMEANEHDQSGGSGGMQAMSGMDMSMTTEIKSLAAGVGLLTGIFLVGLVILRPAWAQTGIMPELNSAEQVGNMLMGKYMMAFEGAGLLILVGIFGAVLLARAGRFAKDVDRKKMVAEDAAPQPIEADELQPLAGHPESLEPVSVPEIHADDRS